MSSESIYIDQENFITENEKIQLLDFFSKSPRLWHKPTGPITLLLDEENKLIYSFIVERIAILLKKKISFICGNFFNTSTPYNIHCDGLTEQPILPTYHVVLIPLNYTPTMPKKTSHLVLFDNFYFIEPTKFFFGESSIHEFKKASYPLKISPEDISNYDLSNTCFKTDLDHLKPEWLRGLTIQQKISWEPQKLIIFPSSQLHCSSNFKNENITSKIGLSMVVNII